MERGEYGRSPEWERPINDFELEYLQRVLGNLGLYDASQDVINNPDHPEDDQWIIKSEN